MRLRALAILLSAAACNSSMQGPPAPDGFALPDGTDVTPDDLADPGPDLAPLGPPYPIVLVHGMAGFKNIGPIDYFYGVADALRKEGHDVYVSTADPLNTSEIRGAQVKTFVDGVLASTHKAKVNLIGHSQGGFDVRYVASLEGDHIASVTTIASPMLGDPIADIATGAISGDTQSVLGAVLNLYGAVMGYTSDVKSQLAELTTAGAKDFFTKFPDDPHVIYYSIAGRSSGQMGDVDCASSTPAPFVSRWDGSIDQLNPALAIPGAVLDGMKPRPVHDGMVTVGSARHGIFLGCIPADHLGEVGQPVGQAAGPGNSFDYLQFYRDLAAYLVAHGH